MSPIVLQADKRRGVSTSRSGFEEFHAIIRAKLQVLPAVIHSFVGSAKPV